MRIYQGSCRLTVAFTNFRPIRKLLAKDFLLASIRLLRMCLRLAAGGAFYFLAFRATQEVAPGRMRLVSTVLEVASSVGVRGLPTLRIPARGSSPSPRPRRSGFAGSRVLLLLAAGLPPRRDSQVGPGPPALAPPPWRRRGRVPAAEYAPQPGAGRGPAVGQLR